MIARDPSGMLDMREAGTLAGVSVRTIRSWREKGYLARSGIGDRGNPLFTAESVRAAEQLARSKGIQASGIDPRLLRQRPAALPGRAAPCDNAREACPMQSPGRGRWCEEHCRWECVSPCKDGRPCHSNRMVADTDKCRMHLGKKARDVIAEEAARAAVVTYGLPRDISPTDALLEEVRYTAGHVAWLRERVAGLEEADLVWGMTEQSEKQATEFSGTDTTYAAKPNVWLQLYMQERKHLVEVTKAAISVGIEERRVKLAEAQGALLNGVIRRILDRLSLSGEQRALLPLVVPEELRRAATMASAN